MERIFVSPDCPVVVLVDDHEDSAAMYAIGLLAMGFQPVTSESAEDAFARACEIRPDLVVADVTLTGGSGVELARRLRGDRRTEHAGIIVLTGHAVGSTRQEATDAGCDRFLLKPCLPDVLALEILHVMNQRQAREMSTLPQPVIANGATSGHVNPEHIAHRAFELYCARGCEDGHDVDDWLQAEQELRASDERTKIDGRSPLMGAKARASGELEPGQPRRGTSPESHAEV